MRTSRDHRRLARETLLALLVVALTFLNFGHSSAVFAAGGRVVVTRTTDGGRTFTALTRGLPQHDAYDLVYRHGLDVAADGGTLAMGSTTGHVWIGRDGGEQWQPLDASLPPIAAVRWVEPA